MSTLKNHPSSFSTNETITRDQLLALLKISNSSLFRLRSTDTFPQPVLISRRIIWIRSEIDTWMRDTRAPKTQIPAVSSLRSQNASAVPSC